LRQQARERLADLGQPSSDGMTVRKLSPQIGRLWSVSRDGRLLVFEPKESQDIAIHQIETGRTWTAVKLTAKDGVRAAVVSPDGRIIAYSRLTVAGPATGIHVANVDGTEAKQIYKFETRTLPLLLPMEWTPDGDKLTANSTSARTSSFGGTARWRSRRRNFGCWSISRAAPDAPSPATSS
jgi:Tol biopolymer transport system component